MDWRVLRDDGDTLLLGLGSWTNEGPSGPGAHSLGLQRDGEAWRPTGWGDCHLSPVLKSSVTWVEVTSYRGDADSTALIAKIDERECTSGRDPEPFLREPYVVETADSVTIYWTSDSPSGDQNCQGNPSVERSLQLANPLGDRLVFDGFNYPPRLLEGRPLPSR